jgi:predicted nucleotidyltransferase
MPNLLDIVTEMAGAFDRLQLQFALGGALASSYWGIVRTTQDVDCLVAIPALKYQLLANELQALGCRQLDDDGNFVDVAVDRMRSQISDQHLIEFYLDSVRIELFVPIVPLQTEILRRAVMMPIGGRDVPITTAEDLILLKLAFHRAKDLQDVRGIIWIQRGRLDLDYLRIWSAKSLDPTVQLELDEMIAEYGVE